MKHHLALVLCATLFASACAAQPTATVQPTQAPPAITLSVSGSGSITPVLAAIAAEFQTDNPGFVLEVLPGSDTGDAVRAVTEGVLDFAAMSRLPRDTEALEFTPIGGSSTAVFTHPDVGVRELTSEQLTGLFDGTITNWSEVGGSDLPVIVYIRDSEEGNTVDLRETFIGEVEFATSAQLRNSQTEMQTVVASVEGALGYGTWATVLANAAEVQSLTIDDIGTDNVPESLRSIMGIGYMADQQTNLQPLLDWLPSAKGQAALQAIGVTPLVEA